MYYIYDVNGTEYTKVPVEFHHVSSSKRKQESHGNNPEEPAKYLTFIYEASSNPKNEGNTKAGGGKYLSFGFADAQHPDYLIEYSFDNGTTWDALIGSKLYINDFITNSGDKVLLRGTKCDGVRIGANLQYEGQFAVSGDLNSMLNGKGGTVEKESFPVQFSWNSTNFKFNDTEPLYSSGNFVSPFTQIYFLSSIGNLFSSIPVKGKGEHFDNSQYVLQQQYPFVLQQYSEDNGGDDNGGKKLKSDGDLWKITVNNDCEFGFWAGLDLRDPTGFTFSNVKTIHLVLDKNDDHGSSPDTIFSALLMEASETSGDVYSDGEPFGIATFISLWDPVTGELYEDGDEAVITIPATVDFKLFIEGSDKLYIKESEEAQWTQPAGNKFTPTDGMYIKMVGGK